MGPALLFDIHRDDYTTLRRFSVVEFESASWGAKTRNNAALLRLLNEANPLLRSDSIVEESIAIDFQGNSIDEFFEQLFESIVGRGETIHRGQPIEFFVLNLMPFSLSTTIADKVAIGLERAKNASRLFETTPLVLFVRNVDWFKKSSGFGKLLTSKISCTLVDIRGIAINYKNGNCVEPNPISRNRFREVLAFKEQEFYRTLIYETNLFLGHFALNHSHVRTHYDLTQFVQRDRVAEHLLAEFEKTITGFEDVFILSVGLGTSALTRLGYFFQSALPNRIRHFDHLPDVNTLDDRLTRADGVDLFVIFTDIINSGETVKAAINGVRRRLLRPPPIRIFALLRMQNSPDAIDGVKVEASVQIRREFYKPNEKQCPLCELDQPLQRVQRAEEFRQHTADQLTPLDYWEMAHDSKALHCRSADIQGRKFEFRVKTELVLARYRLWIKSLVRLKCQSVWPGNTPSILLTVDEPPSKSFATVVAEAVDLDRKGVRVVSREALRTATPSAGPATGKNLLSDAPERVLIVDDGINTGRTITALIDYCRSARVNPMGVFVFDSRLNHDQTQQLELKMGGNKLLALYSWPSVAIPYG